MRLYVGLTGPLRAGKTTVGNLLSSFVAEHDVKVVPFSFSGEIRNELEKEGAYIQRETLRDKANGDRRDFGNDVWALRVESRIADYLEALDEEGTQAPILFLIDGIRTPGEVHEFRQQYSSQFLLMGITAPMERLQENVQTQRREDESERALTDEQYVQRLVESEMGLRQPRYGHDVAACIAMADLPVIENNGSLSELETQVRALVNEYILPRLTSEKPKSPT